jgi:hypothetical protein
MYVESGEVQAIRICTDHAVLYSLGLRSAEHQSGLPGSTGPVSALVGYQLAFGSRPIQIRSMISPANSLR